MKNLRGVVQAIRESHHVMVCSHVEPDGDSVGSQLAMASILRDLGKGVAIVNQDPVPARYKFLDSCGLIRDQLPAGFRPDTVAMLDCSTLDRLGTVRDFIAPDATVITIDHHPYLSKPEDPTYLEPKASSTGELIVDLLKDLEIPIGRERAIQLYTAIIADTGGFRFPNTSAKCLAVAAELAAEGAKPDSIAAQVYEQRSASSLKLLGRALGKIETLENNRVGLVCLDRRDMEECQAHPDGAAGIADHLLSLKGCLVGVLSRGAIKSNKIAEALGGGGHPNAAGYRAKGSLSMVRDRALMEIKKWL